MTPPQSEEERARISRVQELDARKPTTWSDDDAMFHLEWTFDAAVKRHPDAMERFLPRLEGVNDPKERMIIMRYALSQTIRGRYR